MYLFQKFYVLPSFKSCPREGASRIVQIRHAVGHVSSHAPVRGHQKKRVQDAANAEVSSHAPVRGHQIRNAYQAYQQVFQVMPP